MPDNILHSSSIPASKQSSVNRGAAKITSDPTASVSQQHWSDAEANNARRVIKILRRSSLRGFDVCEMDLLHDKTKGYAFACAYRGRGMFATNPFRALFPVADGFARSWVSRHCPDYYAAEFGVSYGPGNVVEIPDLWPDDKIDTDIDDITRRIILAKIRQQYGLDLANNDVVCAPQVVRKVQRLILREFCRGPLARCAWDYVPVCLAASLYYAWYRRLGFPQRFASNIGMLPSCAAHTFLCDCDDLSGLIVTEEFGSDPEVDWGWAGDYIGDVDCLVEMKTPEPLIGEYGLDKWWHLRYGVTEELVSGEQVRGYNCWRYYDTLIRYSTWCFGRVQYTPKALDGTRGGSLAEVSRVKRGQFWIDAPDPLSKPCPVKTASHPPVEYPIPAEARAILESCPEERRKRWDINIARSIARAYSRDQKTHRVMTLYCSDSGEYFFHYIYKRTATYGEQFAASVPVTREYAQYWLYWHGPVEYIREFGPVYNVASDYYMADTWIELYINERR